MKKLFRSARNDARTSHTRASAGLLPVLAGRIFFSAFHPDKGDKTQRRRLSRRPLARVRVGPIAQPSRGKGRLAASSRNRAAGRKGNSLVNKPTGISRIDRHPLNPPTEAPTSFADISFPQSPAGPPAPKQNKPATWDPNAYPSANADIPARPAYPFATPGPSACAPTLRDPLPVVNCKDMDRGSQQFVDAIRAASDPAFSGFTGVYSPLSTAPNALQPKDGRPAGTTFDPRAGSK